VVALRKMVSFVGLQFQVVDQKAQMRSWLGTEVDVVERLILVAEVQEQEQEMDFLASYSCEEVGLYMEEY